MIYQPSGGAIEQATNIAIHAKEILKVRERLNAIYAKHTGQSLERIERFMKRDMFMSPNETKEFGIVDEVIEHRLIALVSDAVEGEEKEMKGKGAAIVFNNIRKHPDQLKDMRSHRQPDLPSLGFTSRNGMVSMEQY
ncbi:uncharacterized protein A4U43_C02F12210 [Asparagus officinalis]|uniref:ATP-dependent Clp protease proteolytic subunit n=1 Tax=Asparagus officinalis TaxID=4686 RepID=A0A5P1FIJ2_ASPOF|nr:uncharacterized protein A4U43_C02F12210 [Asparagus officinalis]